MKHKKHKDKSKHERKKLKKRDKKKDRSQKHNESNSSNSSSEEEQQWVEKPVADTSLLDQNVASKSDEQTPLKREDWMNIKNVFPCVFNEKSVSINTGKNDDKPNLDILGQTNKELNPYWKNGGTGLPEENSAKAEPVMDVNWLRKSLQRAKEQAMSEGRSLEEIAAERWGSLETIQLMISKAEDALDKKKYGHRRNTTERHKDNRQFSHHSSKWRKDEYYTTKSKNSDKNEQYRKHDNFHYKKQQEYKKPMNDDCYKNVAKHNTNYFSKRNWQKEKTLQKKEENLVDSSTPKLQDIDPQNSINTDNEGTEEIKPLTEAEMNKLGAKIVKAEIMGNTELANELKDQLNKARELTKSVKSHNKEKVQNVILTQTDSKGVTRPLEPRNQIPESSKHIKRKNVETYDFGKKVRHYFDDDKYSLQQLFQREKGRCTNEDDAALMKVASKNMDMDEIFEEQITRVKSDAKRDDKDRSVAIEEHKRLSRSLDNCHWCIDSKYMLKHMIVTMNSEICLSLPRYTSLTVGHCILTPVQHIACQLQLDENIWEKLKMFKGILYKMFLDQNQYPIFYEIYTNRHKFFHMQLQCVPLPKEIGELAPIYFKKALLECETEWSVNKKVVSLENKDLRHAIPNGLSYFMVEFEKNKGYAHVIEDERAFPKNFAEEIIGGMLDMDHDIWRKPRKENFDQQREKVLKFSEIWKNYELEINNKD